MWLGFVVAPFVRLHSVGTGRHVSPCHRVCGVCGAGRPVFGMAMVGMVKEVVLVFVLSLLHTGNIGAT